MGSLWHISDCGLSLSYTICEHASSATSRHPHISLALHFDMVTSPSHMSHFEFKSTVMTMLKEVVRQLPS